jgi:hypothetical protein
MSPEIWLALAKQSEPELIADDDLDGLIAKAPHEVIIELARRHLGMIYRRIIHPNAQNRRAEQTATISEAKQQFQIFVGRIYDRYATWTKERANREVGALHTIFTSLKPRQRLCDALSREQFIERFAELSAKR